MLLIVLMLLLLLLLAMVEDTKELRVRRRYVGDGVACGHQAGKVGQTSGAVALATTELRGSPTASADLALL